MVYMFASSMKLTFSPYKWLIDSSNIVTDLDGSFKSFGNGYFNIRYFSSVFVAMRISSMYTAMITVSVLSVDT